MNITMDKKIKKLWLDGLRSGDFKQGKNALCKDGAFCCLGVLQEVRHRNDPNSVKKGDPNILNEVAYDGNMCSIGRKSLETLFLHNYIDPLTFSDDLNLFDGASLNITLQSYLINANDGGKTFLQIADFIDRNVQGV